MNNNNKSPPNNTPLETEEIAFKSPNGDEKLPTSKTNLNEVIDENEIIPELDIDTKEEKKVETAEDAIAGFIGIENVTLTEDVKHINLNKAFLASTSNIKTKFNEYNNGYY